MTLSLHPTIQSLILHMYTIFEDSRLHSSKENCHINLAVKKNRTRAPQAEQYTPAAK